LNTCSLENCIATLVELRDVYSSQLDARALDQLSSVIADLHSVREHAHSAAEVSQMMMRSLQVIALVVRIVTDVGKWMQ
jgi:hypothetical protein